VACTEKTPVRPSGLRRPLDAALLGSVSLLALLVAGDPADARPLGVIAPTMSAQQAATAAAQQAAGAAAQAQASLARAAVALGAMRKVQQDAAAAAQAASSSVPNGLGSGGLMPAGGTASDPLAGIYADLAKATQTTWRGAGLPTQTSSGSNVTVDITQNQPKAILNWNTFNVGANTTLNFHQSGSDWIALNRVLDPTLAPSQILGHVNAPGSVYVINRNGIIFGAGSQINVHSLIASTLDVGSLGSNQSVRDQYFLNTGIANTNSFSIFDPVGGANTTVTGGAITVQPGASITTSVVGLDSPGFVYLFGANVTNAGTITVPAGEVALVAARTIDVVPNGYSVLPTAVLGTDSSGKALNFRGSEFRISQFAASYPNASGYPNGDSYLTGTGAVTHEGLIVAPRGIVVMNGDRISIDSLHADATDPNSRIVTDAAGEPVRGVISVDTSIGRNSMALLRAATSVDMNGVISSLPYDDGSTLASGGAAGSTVQAFLPAYIEMSAQSTVTVGSSGLISAPSAQVALRAINLGHGKPIYQQTAGLFNQGPDSNGNGGNGDVVSSTRQSPQTVLLDPGATIDVAGLQNVELPATYNFISFQPRGGEFADMPLQRNGVLYGQTLWIDIRASGTRSDGTTWVGTPVADASGYVANVGRSIRQLMTIGGSVGLTTDLTASTSGGGTPGVTQKAGSVINVAGGSVNFLPGTVPTTDLVGSDGRIYSTANADPNMTYVGIAGQFTVNHSRWGVTETWSTRTQTFAPGYSEGHDAGSVTVTTISPSLQGTMLFGSVAGERQIAAGQLPSQGSLTLTTPSSVQIGSAPSADYTTQSAYTTTLSADTLSSYGLSALNVTANDLVVSSGSTLNLAPGGSLSVTTGGAIDIAGTVSAAGGAINLVTDRYTVSNKTSAGLFGAPTDQSGKVIAANIYVEGALDVSGRFVNDTGRTGTDATGPGFINGGSIALATNKSSTGNNVDTTGSIKLAAGSSLDVSSGGYISPQGKPKTAAAGVMAGKAGSISLLLYQGADWIDPNSGSGAPTRPSSGTVAVLQLDGTLRGYGFESNGSLTLGGADTIRIGGTLRPGETSSIQINGQPSTLPASLLTGGGFGAYTLVSTSDGWTGAGANVIVSAGVNLTLQQQNLSSTSDYSATATGTKLGQQQTPPLALLPDDQRKPVNLAFKAGNVLLDTGASIVTDPKASITFGGIDPTLKVGDPMRDVRANSVELRGSIVDHGGTVFINALTAHLGLQAQVDLSGIFVANSRFGAVGGPAISGTYLSGGTFAVEAGAITQVRTLIDPNPNNDKYYYTYSGPGAGYVVADAGATVDVSGSAGTVQVQGSRGNTSSVWSWSDAGTVSADVGGFALGGSFVATGGRYLGTDGITHADPRANNGTFILGGGAISLRQDTTDVNSAVAAFHSGTSPNSIRLAADQLAPFDNIFLYSGASTGGAARFFNELPAYNRLSGNNVLPQTDELPGSIYNIPIAASSFGSLTISGSLNWHARNGLRIAAGKIVSIPDNNTAGSTVTLDAPYVLLTGGGGATTVGKSTLTVSGQTIDVEGAGFSGFAQAILTSSGDIRLSTPKVSDTIDPTTGASTSPGPASPVTFKGSLDTKGDLLLEAQRIYPVSAVDFTITTPGNVKFAAPAGSSTAIPLAAGGSLTVIANTIDQAGNLFAPLGKITLGNTTTQSVTLEPGSLTSVTLADTIVPYGATQDGTNWYYNANLNPLSQPPSKGLELTGAKVTRADGSTIDLRGGGDLQATEWIQGQGGSRDTLTTTPSGQTVYALVPSSNDAVAAFDIHFTTARSATTSGDVNPLAGTQITIDGGNGIPAGTYTLYPAHYATLPGAMRVVYYGDNTGRNLPSGTTLPDGTVLVTGHTTQSTAQAKQSSGQSLFAVQTGAVWKQYSEYTLSGANSYFSQLAAKQGVTTPRLPMDAGRLSVFALQSIILNGIALTQPGQDSSGNTGRGSELDISAPQLAVVGHTQYVNNDILAGYVGLDVTQLNGFESVLIGGQRSDTATGTLITPTASNVLVDTRGENFTDPEILLVAKAVGEWQTIPQILTVSSTDPLTSQVTTKTVAVETQIFAPAPNSGTVTIAAGSVITTTGEVHAGSGRDYYFADPSPNGTTTAQNVAAALGGKLDASGTVITGVDLSKLDYFAKNADGSFVTNADGSLYHHAGSISAAGLAALQTYAYQTSRPQLGGLFVATNDSGLKVSGPTGVAPPALTIQFGPSTDPKATGAVSGSLLLPTDAGRVSIEPGANITTKSLTLQATASVNAIVVNSNDLHVGQLNLTARTIGLGASSLVSDKSLALYNQQFQDVGALSLKALSGIITVYGVFNPGPSVASLTLDAGAVVRAEGGQDAYLSLDRGTLTLVNTGTASTAAASPSSSGRFGLSVVAPDIVLGGGTQTILGYGQVNLNASDRVFVAGAGALTLGAGTDVVNLNVTTPNILVASATGSGSFAVTTLGNITVADSAARSGLVARPVDSSEIGGNLALTGASITIGSTIQAQAGTVTLEAKTGDVRLGPGAYIAAGGSRKTLVDVDTYVAGGKVVLQADAGNVTTDASSVIDVAQPVNGFGYGGEIDVTALAGNATLAGALRGGGGPGLGGRFKLDIKGPADLTALADDLLLGGLTGAIDIHTRTGNLELSQGHTLKANAITLTADDTTWIDATSSQPAVYNGQVIIEGTVDASGYSGNTLDGTGQAGGQVGLYGANQVKLAGTGVIDASTTHADERGGDVMVGIAWAAKGNILLQTGTQINVSGGTKGGLSGGTVTFRAPRDGNNDVKIWAIDGAGNKLPTIDGTSIKITGARAVTVEGYLAFDTKAGGKYGIDGSQLGWNGTIDPAGWYNPDGTVATSGSWSNVSGWQISRVTNNSLFGFTGVPTASVTGGGGSGATATAVMGLRPNVGGFFQFTNFVVQNPGLPANQSNIPISFPTPPGGVAATGTASTDASGKLTITITNPGSGYTSVPTSATVGGMSTTVTGGRLQVVSAQITSLGNGAYDSGSSAPTATFLGGGGNAQVSFSQGSNFSGQTNNGRFTPDTTNFIPFKSSGVYSAFDPTTQGTAGVANFTGATPDRTFFATTLVQATQGTWSYNGKNYGFDNLFARLQPLANQVGSDVMHVQPGIELVNSTGSITVKDNWNLASGTAGNLQTGTNATTGQSFQYFDPTSSYVNFNYRLVTPWGVDPGALTLRAAGDINIKASISDGFFQFGNYLDPNYLSWVASYLQNNPRTMDQKGLYTYYLNNFSSSAVPIAPYSPAANAVSPTAQDLAVADLFPNQLRVCTVDCGAANIKAVTAPGSWSYGFTAGADTASANPHAMIALASAQQGNSGNGIGSVIVDKHSTYTQSLKVDDSSNPNINVTVNLPTMVRTGTGSISIAAALDLKLADTVAPGVIYAAGVNTAKLADPNYSLQTVNGVSGVAASNPDGFFEPQVLAYGNRATNGSGVYYGPPTAAAFPERGGDVAIDAQRDIVGYSGTGNKTVQYFQPWLLSDTGLTPVTATAGAASLFGAGVFTPFGTQIASQTAWWIQYGSFQQGILSAGGNVSATAGRDLVDVSVSLPTTGRVSGGLSATSTPVTHVYGGGNMVVRAGRDILGGSFYEGSGHASIMAGGSVGQNGTVSRYASSTLLLPDVPLLAVDTGQIAMVAGGSISMAGVVNPAELHTQNPSFANPSPDSSQLPLYMDTYGPDSKVRLVATTGDVNITVAPTAITDQSILNSAVHAAAAMYPASFEALALNGNLITKGITIINQAGQLVTIDQANGSIPMPGIVLSPSDHGTFELLAQGNVDLTFGYPTDTPLLTATPRPFISAGPALIDTAFDPFHPNSGFDGALSSPVLAHQNDATAQLDTTARIYAASGDILATGSYGQRTKGDPKAAVYQQRIEINRPAKLHAGRDIVDLNLIVQNIHPYDVSTVNAGRNITYTGWNNAGGLQVAGPGFFVVQAGGDIGPFLPAAQDLATQASVQEGIASVGNASAVPVGDIYVSATNGGSVGLYDAALYGPLSNPRRNTLLTTAANTTQGADVVVLFGAKYGVDYQAVINTYVDPLNTANVGHNYIDELRAFLVRIGKPASATDATTVFDAFKALPADLQQVFVDQVFFAELKTVAISQQAGAVQYQPGYRMINTMFPSSLGYTANALGGGATNGASQLVKTGDLNLLHGTIQTRLGGNVSIFGPGGSILVGSLATEPNPNLKLRDLGILTLGGGGINTFTDASVLVNSSRVLTTQGGDVLMWSSNGDLDAGRGSKTTVSQPPLQVQYDANDYQSVDLGGFVSGAGIGTLQASTAAAASNLDLLAPRGKIDFGSAGVRSSGNLVVSAPVIVNASNASVQGSTSGTPVVSAPNIGALTSGSNTTGATARTADAPTASGNRDVASVFIVEIIGYGGGDGQSQPPADGGQQSDDTKSDKRKH
jgi:filamentous hemagglutinin family protein